jgi:5'-nucleotidase
MKRRSAAVFLALLCATVVTAAEVARPHLLITNDDGIDHPGLVALVNELSADYRITVAAPAANQSSVSHGVTLHAPVLVEERPGQDGVRWFAVHAQPATCTRLAVTGLLTQDPPVLVLSGINRGANDGRSAWLSGTVAGAREAALAGLPGVAISAARPSEKGDPDYAAAARLARLVLQQLRAAGLPSPGQVLKVEIPHPAAQARGVLVTRMSTAPEKEDVYVESKGPGGERLFTNKRTPVDRDAPGTDVETVAEGFVSVTPLLLDQTEYRALPALMAIPWSLTAAAAEPTRER